MTAAMPDHRHVAPSAADTAERLWDDPALEGYRIEAISGRVILAPPPDGDHAVALTDLMDLLRDAGMKRRGLRAVQGVGLALPEGAGEFAVPDLSVVDEDFRDSRLPKGLHPPKVFHVVVEITSANWQDDLRIKPDAYASAGVPVYLIGDRQHAEVRVLSRPERGEYLNVSTHKPGETLTLPGDFAAELSVDLLLQC